MVEGRRDMSELPENIWIWAFMSAKQNEFMTGGWHDEPEQHPTGKETRYIPYDKHTGYLADIKAAYGEACDRIAELELVLKGSDMSMRDKIAAIVHEHETGGVDHCGAADAIIAALPVYDAQQARIAQLETYLKLNKQKGDAQDRKLGIAKQRK
jgi:hypothetical protein